MGEHLGDSYGKRDCLMAVLPRSSQEPLLLAVGRGIQSFAMVETGLGFVFASLMAPGGREEAFIILELVRQFDTKLRLTGKVADVALKDNDETLQRWRQLSSQLQSSAKFRNKLAHWTTNYWPARDTGQEPAEPALLIPPHAVDYWSTLYGEPEDVKHKPIFLPEVDDFVESCKRAYPKLCRLANDIAGQRAVKAVPSVVKVWVAAGDEV